MNDQPLARRTGFTLIELLIVVAIIAILAAIAVPNFLEAQTRSKVSRTKADMRSVATAIESYFVDHNHYAPEHDPNHQLITLSNGELRCGPAPPGDASWNPCEFANIALVRLTTPISYISSIEATSDPFYTGDSVYNYDPTAIVPFPYYFYVNYYDRTHMPSFITALGGDPPPNKAWGLQSLGPDHMDNGITNGFQNYFLGWGIDQFINMVYDPTNGTVSSGDLTRLGGEIPGNVKTVIDTTE